MLSWLRHLAILLAVLSPGLLAGTFRGAYLNGPPAEAQLEPSGGTRLINRLWRGIARLGAEEGARQWARIKRTLLEESERFPKPPARPVEDDRDLFLQASYGVVPQVLVDLGPASQLPRPMREPRRFSWYQTVLELSGLLLDLDSLEDGLERWRHLPLTDRMEGYATLAGRYEAIHERFVRVASLMRYLETWATPLEAQWESIQQRGRVPAAYRLANLPEILEKDPASVASLRSELRPKRTFARGYLPADLNRWRGKNILFPIVTDVTDPGFLKEVEGALEMHWNRSPWARTHGIRFQIRWRQVPGDIAFHMGVVTLSQHLSKFPPGPAVITTGGLTTHVRDRFLILGPGRLSARTLAHELGHLMGFEDCYLRTLSAQGIFGQAVLEWENPFFQDELMCDDKAGVARELDW